MSSKIKLLERKDLNQEVLIEELSEFGASISSLCDSVVKEELVSTLAEAEELKEKLSKELMRVFSRKIKEYDAMIIQAAMSNLRGVIADGKGACFQLIELGREMLLEQRAEAVRVLKNKTIPISPTKRTLPDPTGRNQQPLFPV